MARARAGIEKLVHLTPQTARRLRNGGEEVIPAEQVAVDDVLRVLPGETVPVDGVILTGHTSINQAVMTGESLPVDKGPGDEVSSGTVNQFGAFEMRAAKVGEDSSIQRMIRLVQSADAGKAKIVGLADRWATWIVVAALTAAALTGLLTRDPIRAVTILVVFCPCALVLATPTAIMAAIGNATKHSFLVREGDALERLASVSQVTFDKTGTLTFGAPQVRSAESLLPDISRQDLYGWTAGAELRSEHPLGRAIVQGWQAETGQAPPEAADFQMLPGRGVSAAVAGHQVIAGNRELLAERNIPWEPLSQAAAPALDQGCTVIYVAVDGRPAGFLALADTLRPDAAQTIRNVQAAGVTPVLLTGDHEKAARHIAGQLGISTFRAECLPEDKLAWIDRSQQAGQLVCMVGDGINDAPALKRAHVGIAMGGRGQRHRRGCGGHRPGERRHPGAAPPAGPLPPDDDHHQVQPGLLHDPELHRHRPGHHRHPEPGGGGPGPQRRVCAGDHQLLPAAEVEAEILTPSENRRPGCAGAALFLIPSALQGVQQMADVDAHGVAGARLVPLHEKIQDHLVVRDGNALHMLPVGGDLEDLVHRAVDDGIQAGAYIRCGTP